MEVDYVRVYEASTLSNQAETVPDHLGLLQNYPNPFNPITTISYDLPENGFVNITIYDIMGKPVKDLVNSQQNAGFKSIQWDATNNRGQSVSAGLYLYTIQAGNFRQTKKMVLLKWATQSILAKESKMNSAVIGGVVVVMIVIIVAIASKQNNKGDN